MFAWWPYGFYNKRGWCRCRMVLSLNYQAAKCTCGPDLLGATSSVLPVIRSPCKPSFAVRAEISHLPLFCDKGEIITCPTGLCILWLEKSVWWMMPLRHWDTGGTLVLDHKAGLSDQAGRLLVVKTPNPLGVFLWSHSDFLVFFGEILP